MGAYKRKGNGLRSAINVSKCSHNVTGALLGCRFHNPKVGSSILPPATNKINDLQNRQRAEMPICDGIVTALIF